MINLEFEGSRVKSWKIGDKSPIDTMREYDKLKSIFITEEEVQYVYKMFTDEVKSYDISIYKKPEFIPKGSEVRIFGDLAKTIISNLNYSQQ